MKKQKWLIIQKQIYFKTVKSKSKLKDYKISDESQAIIFAAKQGADKKGNIKLSDRAIDKLIEKKAIGKVIPDYMKLPSAYSGKGGFS